MHPDLPGKSWQMTQFCVYNKGTTGPLGECVSSGGTEGTRMSTWDFHNLRVPNHPLKWLKIYTPALMCEGPTHTCQHVQTAVDCWCVGGVYGGSFWSEVYDELWKRKLTFGEGISCTKHSRRLFIIIYKTHIRTSFLQLNSWPSNIGSWLKFRASVIFISQSN